MDTEAGTSHDAAREQVRDLLHDLRNPLAALYTAVAILRELPGATRLSDVGRHLTLIEQSSARVAALIEKAQTRVDATFDEKDGTGPANDNRPGGSADD